MIIDMPIIDLETRGRVSLKYSGLARYARDPDTSILVMSYIMPGELTLDRVKRWSPGDYFPQDLWHAMAAGLPIGAWNAGFEAALLRARVDLPHDLINWYDFAGHARYVGIPGGLEAAGLWLGLPPNLLKSKEGHDIMMKVSVPISAGKLKGGWNEDPILFAKTCDYCDQDVLAEGAAYLRLPPWPKVEQDIWLMTFNQNLRGCPIDLALCNGVVKIVSDLVDRAREVISDRTGGVVLSPTQTAAIVKWLNEKGVNVDNIQALTVSELLKDPNLNGDVRAVLEARQVGAPASVKKFSAALNREVGGRLYHNFMYCGGGATGRWSGKSDDSETVQLQNLKRGKQTEEILDLIKTGDAAVLSAVCDNPIKELQNATRSMLCAGDDHVFLYTDLSAIEARTLRWLARSPALEDFRNYDAGGPDPYKMEAAKTFDRPVESITDDERQCGKVLVLQGQYQSGWQKVQNTVSVWSGGAVTITDEFAQTAVEKYRKANPEILKLWKQLERAFTVVLSGERATCMAGGHLEFANPYKGVVTMKLPSGRLVYYNKCRFLDKDTQVGERSLRKGSIAYVKHDGLLVGYYGGHGAENAASGMARDLMAEGMLAVEAAGLHVVHHAHDGLLVEAPNNQFVQAMLATLARCMTSVPEWANGLPLASPVKIVKRMP